MSSEPSPPPDDKGALRKQLIDDLSELQSVETQLMKALPKVARASACNKLEILASHHLKETEGQAARLKKIAKKLEAELDDQKTSAAMKALIEEAEKLLEPNNSSLARDVAIIAACRKIEQYEIAAYTAAQSLAKRAGEPEAAQLLEETLKEEKTADALLGATAGEIEAGTIHPKPS